MARILIVDNINEQAAARFEESVRPLLKAPVEVDVVASASEALERLAATDYALAIVESMLQKRPVDLLNLGAFDPADLACPAADVLPLLLKRRPGLKVVVVAHSRSGTDKDEKARLSALPGVLGLFGWLNTAKNARAVADLVDRASSGG